MSKTIQYMSEKQADGTYSTPIPFGVFGENVKMADLNNLEEELKLGGSCETSFVESDNFTTITEKYGSGYSIITTIEESIITQKLYNGDDLIKTKIVTFDNDVIKEVIQ